jgi:DNA polymerase III sliding clamp (beta) subunit (PCNA family)
MEKQMKNDIGKNPLECVIERYISDGKATKSEIMTFLNTLNWDVTQKEVDKILKRLKKVNKDIKEELEKNMPKKSESELKKKPEKTDTEEPKIESEKTEEKEFAIGILKSIKINMQGKKEIWQNIVDKLIGLQEDVVFVIEKNGIHVRLTDAGHVALADLTTKKKGFSEYSINHEISIGVDLKKLQKHIKAHATAKTLTVTNDENRLIFTDEHKHVTRMGLLDSSSFPDIKIPEMDFDVELKTSFGDISSMVKISNDFGVDALIFEIKNSKFTIFMDGETDDARFPICTVDNLTGKRDFQSIYSSEYLGLFSFDANDEVIVKFAKDKPIYFEYDDDEERIVYLLAPRIETE